MNSSKCWSRKKHISFCSRLSQSALNNEFLTKACHEWKERLLRGDFTSESLQRAKVEIEKDKSNVDPWKVLIFEFLYIIPPPQITLRNLSHSKVSSLSFYRLATLNQYGAWKRTITKVKEYSKKRKSYHDEELPYMVSADLQVCQARCTTSLHHYLKN